MGRCLSSTRIALFGLMSPLSTNQSIQLGLYSIQRLSYPKSKIKIIYNVEPLIDFQSSAGHIPIKIPDLTDSWKYKWSSCYMTTPTYDPRSKERNIEQRENNKHENKDPVEINHVTCDLQKLIITPSWFPFGTKINRQNSKTP